MAWAVEQTRSKRPIISGFHSPLEQFVLEVMLTAGAPCVMVIARELVQAHLPPAWLLAVQNGTERAEYGKELLKELFMRLTEEFGKGFSERNLRSFRALYLAYQDRPEAIWQKASAKFDGDEIGQQATDQSQISQKPSRKYPFTLSWSHYVLLLTIKNPEERSSYEIEATNAGWSLPELKRQGAGAGGGLWSRKRSLRRQSSP